MCVCVCARAREYVVVHVVLEQFETSPRRSSKNCDLQFSSSDIFKENYSIDTSVCQCTHACASTYTHTRLKHASRRSLT